MAQTNPNKTPTELEQEFETRLIRAVYNFKLLYDNSHVDFNNATKNRISWARVSNICQRPIADCTNRWNSLLQTYFTSTSVNWIHHEDLKKFEPHLHNNFRIPVQLNPNNQPNENQKHELLSSLMANKLKMLSTQTTLVERQGIWTHITIKCNAIQPGAYMGALEWKKYWYEMKQSFGIQRLMLQSKLRAMGTKLDVSKYSEDDMKILKICGASADDTLSVILKALGSNIEIGFNSDLIIPKCVRCLKQKNQLIIDGYCETCHYLPSCDVCHAICENNTVRYKTTNWSNTAKSLLPTELESVNGITVCFDCSRELKKKATLQWKACRICESEQPNLELLHGNNNLLRKVLINITNVTISESDGLPGYICKCCKIQVQQLNNFYTKFCRIQIKLKNMHSTYFIANSVDLKDEKDENDKQKAVTIVTSDTNVQREQTTIPLSSTSASSSASTAINVSTVQQNKLPAYKISTAISAPSVTSGNFKRLNVQKIVKADGTPNGNVTQGVEVKQRVIPLNPPLAIKDIFSLQPSAQKPKAVSKPNIKVIPTAALQQAKMHGVFSNETVTVTRKTIDVSATTTPPPSTTPASSTINTKQQINIVNMANGNSVTLQPQANPITLHRGFTLTKRPPVSQTETNSTLIKPSEVDKIPSKPAYAPAPAPAPATETTQVITVSSKAPVSTKPAIFTISDYETVEDAPPVFCIPKKNIQVENNTAETEAEKQLMNFNPQNAPFIKTEILDPEEYQNEEAAIQTNVVPGPQPMPTQMPMPLPAPMPMPTPMPAPTSTPTPIPTPLPMPMAMPTPTPHIPMPTASIENIPGLPPLINEIEPSTNAGGMKIIRLNGSMVAVKPHPHISGAFIPVDLNSSMDSQGKANRIPSYIRKVDTGQKSLLASSNLAPKKVTNTPEGKQIVPARKLPTKVLAKTIQGPSINPSNVQYNQPVPDINLRMAPDQVDQLMQAQKRQEQLQSQQHKDLHQQNLQLQLQKHQLQHQIDQRLQEQQQQLQKEKLQQQQQPQQQQLQQQGLKKPRKYWGNVDEFHVANQPTKTTLPPPSSFSQPLSMATKQQQPIETPQQPMQRTASSPWIEERKTPTPTEDPLKISNVPIKQEIPDNETDDVTLAKQNDTTPGMFYPDSIELENLTFEADVSLMINKIMIQQNSIIDSNMDGNNFNKYLNPAFPISYGKRKQPQVEDKQKCKQIKTEDNAVVEANADAEVIQKTQEKENDKKIKSNGHKKQSSIVCGVKIKNFCIKLKRNTEPKIISRPKRLCTLQSKSSTPTSPATSMLASSSVTAPMSVPIRKSLRLNHA